MPKRKCNRCSSIYSCRQSLHTHRKKCGITKQQPNDLKYQQSKIGEGIMKTYDGKQDALNYPKNHLSLEKYNAKDDDGCELEIEPEDNQVTDLYNWKGKSIPRNHSPLLPRDIRAINNNNNGKSGAGKTTLLAHLLLEPEMLDYENLMICGRSLNQPQYQVMQHGFNNNLSKQQIRKIFKHQERIGDIFEDLESGRDVEEFVKQFNRKREGNIVAEFHDDVKDIPDPNE